MRLVKVKKASGRSCWINPEKVVTIEVSPVAPTLIRLSFQPEDYLDVLGVLDEVTAKIQGGLYGEMP